MKKLFEGFHGYGDIEMIECNFRLISVECLLRNGIGPQASNLQQNIVEQR